MSEVRQMIQKWEMGKTESTLSADQWDHAGSISLVIVQWFTNRTPQNPGQQFLGGVSEGYCYCCFI